LHGVALPWRLAAKRDAGTNIIKVLGDRGIKHYGVFSFLNFPHEKRDGRKLCGKAPPLMNSIAKGKN
jgi:hypothetical protein